MRRIAALWLPHCLASSTAKPATKKLFECRILVVAHPPTRMHSLQTINDFGEIAAEDDDLRQFFVSTPVFESIVRNSKQIVLGRKGSGKSALYLAVKYHGPERNYIAKGLTFSDYPWSTHYKYSRDDVDSYERFVASWEFLALLEISKAVIQSGLENYDKRQRSALSDLESFIKSNYGYIDFDYKKTFPKGNFDFSAINLEPQILGNSLGGAEIARKGGLGDTIVRLNDWIWNILKSLNGSAPEVFVLFDELDSGFDPNSENYVDRVTGLLLACRNFKRRVKDTHLPFRAVAFLRTDIYASLHFSDKNKITDSNTIELSWNDDIKYHGSSLKQLIDYRIRRRMEIDEDTQNVWNVAFTEKVMRGTQHKFNHITFRTFLRPRDVIKFCNLSLEKAKLRHSRDGGSDRITNSDIASARSDYSRYLIDELDDEIAASVPEWKSYLEVIRKLSSTRFTRDAFDFALTESRKRLDINMSTDQALHFLYDYSIIGFQRSGRTGPGQGYYDHFRYMDERVPFDINSPGFLLHRGLKDYLEVPDRGEPVDAG